MRSDNVAPIPYEELDQNIVKLVKALNAFDGLRTVESCGGHKDEGPGQLPEGRWEVFFRIDHNDAGFLALEFLTWAIEDIDRGWAIEARLKTPIKDATREELVAAIEAPQNDEDQPTQRRAIGSGLQSAPPDLNTPGECLTFFIKCEGGNPDEVADQIATWKAELFDAYTEWLRV